MLWTEGGVTRKCRRRSASAGGRPSTGVQRLNRRVGECDRLTAEIAAWQERRNAAARVKWTFFTERARAKLARAYPDTTNLS